MNPEQIRAAKQALEQDAADRLAALIKKFEEETDMSVEGVTVSIDTFGGRGPNLQHVHAPLTVSILLKRL